MCALDYLEKARVTVWDLQKLHWIIEHDMTVGSLIIIATEKGRGWVQREHG